MAIRQRCQAAHDATQPVVPPALLPAVGSKLRTTLLQDFLGTGWVWGKCVKGWALCRGLAQRESPLELFPIPPPFPCSLNMTHEPGILASNALCSRFWSTPVLVHTAHRQPTPRQFHPDRR